MLKVYNIIADLCSYIIRSCDEEFFVRYSCMVPAEKDKAYTEIGNRVIQLNRDKLNARPLNTEELDDSFYDALEKYIEELKGKKDYFGVVCLVQVIDDGLSAILLDKIMELEVDDFSVVLNTNREETGIGLLPRCSCMWERKNRLSHSYNRMDNFLFNMLLMENEILGEIIDKHFFLKKDMFPDIANKRKIKIATTPLRIERNFKAELFEDDKVQCFKIIHDEKYYDEDNRLIWNKIIEAAKNKSDIVLFPEMLGNKETAGFIGRMIKEKKQEEKIEFPSLIILPSYWDKNKNIVSIMDGNGDVICKQYKQNPFRIEYGGSAYLEGILPNRVVNIFHFEGIGRIAILICKDFLTTKYMEQLMRCFKLTLIIVPSFSTGSYDFRQSFDLCAHDDCNVVWINTCASIEKGKEANYESIGYVRKRIGRNDDESQKLCAMPVCDNAFKGICDHACMFYETVSGVY